MAFDDMSVVMYRILAYVYDCTKRGIEPDAARWSCVALGVNESYWQKVVIELVEHGYLAGVRVDAFADGATMVSPIDPRVTIEGYQFMTENSAMGKARRFLQDAKAAVPFV